MRQRRELEIFSLSFLDLICCGMAGIIVLYTTAPPEVPERKADQKPPRVLTVEFPVVMAGAEFAVEFRNGGRRYRGSSDASDSQWLFSLNPPQAILQFDEPIDKTAAALRVWIRDFDPFAAASAQDVSDVQCYVTLVDPSRGMTYHGDPRKTVVLKSPDGFDATIAIP